MKFQKGQSIVEFALILPLFLLLVLGIIYFGSIFADYLTLNSIARNSAREAAVVTVSQESQRQAAYNKVRDNYKNQTLPLDIYTWDPTSDADFSIKPDDHNVVVTLHAALNDNGSMLANIVSGLAGDDTRQKLDLNITYTMYSEKNVSDTNSNGR